MFSAVLDRVTSLTSKYFVIGAFVPVLAFGIINGVLADLEFAWFRKWANAQITGTGRAFDAVSVLMGAAIAAYVLWSINGFLRQTLEGQFLAPDSLPGKHLRKLQLERFRRQRTAYFAARNAAMRIRKSKQGWRETLGQRAEQGLTTTIAGAPVANTTNAYDGTSGDAVVALQQLRTLRDGADDVPVAALETAIVKFGDELARNNVSLHAGQSRLAEDWRDLLTLIDYAEDDSTAREIALANELQSRFGGATVAAATAFGNVAASMQSYTLTRYRLNLATFWSRLQVILQKRPEFYGALQDAKVQLDFLVALTWLSGATTFAWLLILGIGHRSPGLFLVVGLLGPLLTRVCYVSAVENYVAFGEVVRAAVDLYRFELLDELHIARPAGLRDERALWQGLQQVTSYGQDWIDISYVPPREQKP